MNSAGVSSKNQRVPPRVENGIAHLDCSLADQHVYIAHFKADTCAKFSACARCRSSRRWHRCYPLLDCHAFASEVTRRWLCEHTDGALSDHDRLSSGVSFAAGFEIVLETGIWA